MPQAASAHDTFWDFISLMPESTHMIMWVMSDRGIPRSFRMMEGFGVHTFLLVNKAGTSRFVKFHWKPLLGVHSVVWATGEGAELLRASRAGVADEGVIVNKDAQAFIKAMKGHRHWTRQRKDDVPA